MDQADERSEREARIKRVDTEYPSPDIRAQAVWEILNKHAPNLTTWDVVCFCVNFLGWQSEYLPWIATPIKHISRLVYTAHYVSADTAIDTGLKRNGRPVGESATQHPSKDAAREQPRERLGFDVSGGGFE